MALLKGDDVPVAVTLVSRSPESVPYRNPISLIVPVSPEKEPCRVAPAELTSSVPPVTTEAVACGVGELQLAENETEYTLTL